MTLERLSGITSQLICTLHFRPWTYYLDFYVSDEEKSFENNERNKLGAFFYSSMMLRTNKLECLSPASFLKASLKFLGKASNLHIKCSTRVNFALSFNL